MFDVGCDFPRSMMMTRSEVGLRKLIAGMGGTRCSEEAAATSPMALIMKYFHKIL